MWYKVDVSWGKNRANCESGMSRCYVHSSVETRNNVITWYCWIPSSTGDGWANEYINTKNVKSNVNNSDTTLRQSPTVV